jgi:hypothetical protein
MTTRTSKKTVTFGSAFTLGGFDEILPAGDYVVEMDEELIQGVSFPVYRRVLTAIHLPAKSGNLALTRTLTIDPNELDAALERDRDPAALSVGNRKAKTPNVISSAQKKGHFNVNTGR